MIFVWDCSWCCRLSVFFYPQNYVVLLDSTLSKSQYDYTLPQVSFTAIGYHKHITLVFSPTVSTKSFHVPVFTLGAVFGVTTCMDFVLLARLSVSVSIKRFMSGIRVTISLDLLCVQLPVEQEGDMEQQQEVKGVLAWLL